MKQPAIRMRIRLAPGPRNEEGAARAPSAVGGPSSHPLLALQCAAGNASVARLLRRVMTPAGPALGKADDSMEREADRQADAALKAKDAGGAGVTREPSVPEAGRGGTALPAETQRLFEQGFGHGFSGVRVHTDAAAGASARMLGARAYTVGQDVVFAPGEYQPGTATGRALIAHELAHVLQQTRAPAPRLQRRLVATGDSAGFAALANSIISVQYEVVVASNGAVSLRSTAVQGPPTREAAVLVEVLRRLIDDSSTTSVGFVHGLSSADPRVRQIIVGSYVLGLLDLDDISAFGRGLGVSAASTLVHELQEQYRKQVHREAYPRAHASGISEEERAMGARRGTERIRQLSATTAEVTVPYTYPDGSVVEVILTLSGTNITSVTRTVTRPRATP